MKLTNKLAVFYTLLVGTLYHAIAAPCNPSPQSDPQSDPQSGHHRILNILEVSDDQERVLVTMKSGRMVCELPFMTTQDMENEPILLQQPVVLTPPDAEKHIALVICQKGSKCLEYIEENGSDVIEAVEYDQPLELDPFVEESLGRGLQGMEEQETPNPFETYYVWGQDRIDGKLDNSVIRPTHLGQGVDVYILDTGVRSTHLDIKGRVAEGISFIPNSPTTEDCNGHGTHTAATAAGSHFGVATLATIVPVRVLSCGGSGYTSWVVSGIVWAADRKSNNRAAVISMSLGGGGNTAIDNAVRYAVSKNIPVVVSAGNSARGACAYSPARVPEAITVGATTITDTRASYSNTGECVDIFAPGSSIPSAWYVSDISVQRLSGTSMACPHVTGVVATILEEYGQARTSADGDVAVGIGLTPAQVNEKLEEWAELNVVFFPGQGSPPYFLRNRSPTDDGSRPPTTPQPTDRPTRPRPTLRPTRSPTERPTRKPTKFPTMRPTRPQPTMRPTRSPTPSPSRSPTLVPTLKPTLSPTLVPTISPTPCPDECRAPTVSPSEVPRGLRCWRIRRKNICNAWFPYCNWGDKINKCYKM